MRYKEIAVIGMSGRFAGAADLQDFRRILLEKKKMIGPPSAKRLSLMDQDQNERYMPCGYLDDIEEFDNTFFDIGKREARLMSPEQRICLEMAAEAILDAGYALNDFRGSKCGVYVADGESEYERFIDKRSSASVIGSKSFMLSGQIGYHFDLRGENLSINSGCSSSLLAVHYACEKITFGEIDTALVGGVLLQSEVPRAKDNQYDILGIMSDDYIIRSFDEKANGTVCGEGGGFLLLKSLEKAERDGDHIYGVLLSGAVNGDGGRCTSASMPSVEAQGDVICKAWEDTNINELTEIEAHGIGAQVGDAVEAQGMIDAVLKYKLKDRAIKISTAKSNIGHLFALSGIASLIKTLVGYQYCESYPIAGLDTLNPLIDFSSAGITPLREVYHWEKDAQRMTGISSFGLNGCNVHIVLRNYVKETNNARPQSLLKLSARSPEAFSKLKHNVLSSLQNTGENCADFIYTMNTGRDDYDYRSVVYGETFTAMQNALEAAVPCQKTDEEYQIIYAVKSENTENPPLEPFERVIPALKKAFSEITGNSDTDRKLMLYNTLIRAGIKSKVLLLDKIFSTAVKVQTGECNKEEFTKILGETEINNDYTAYIKQISNKSERKPTIVVDFSKEMGIRSDNTENVHIFHIQKANELASLIEFCYEKGVQLDWAFLCGGADLCRVPVPVYPFERKTFWIERKKAEKKENTPVVKGISVANTVSSAMSLPHKNLFLICSEKVLDVSISEYPYSDQDFRAVFSAETAEIGTDSRLAMLKYLMAAGVEPDILLADKNGKAVYSFSKGWISSKRLSEAAEIPSYTDTERIISKIEEVAKVNAVTVFDFCRNNSLSEHKWNGAVRIVSVFRDGEFKAYLKDPVFTVQSEEPYVRQPIEDTSAVSEPVALEKANVVAENISKSAEQIEAEQFLERTWAKAFNLDGEIGHDEDFFSLGGNSLIMQSMSNEINEHFDKKFDIFEIYDYETIEKLAAKILEDE